MYVSAYWKRIQQENEKVACTKRAKNKLNSVCRSHFFFLLPHSKLSPATQIFFFSNYMAGSGAFGVAGDFVKAARSQRFA